METIYTAAYWKEKLQLQSHIEGGAYREIYRSSLILPQAVLTPAHHDKCNASTGIYFLLEHGEFSAFHRIASDELWHHYDGAVLSIYEIDKEGQLTRHLLGKDVEKGAFPQIVIPAGSWFGSRVEVPDAYTLCGCTVAPGFEFNDFELADRAQLSAAYPAHTDIIHELTR